MSDAEILSEALGVEVECYELLPASFPDDPKVNEWLSRDDCFYKWMREFLHGVQTPHCKEQHRC